MEKIIEESIKNQGGEMKVKKARKEVYKQFLATEPAVTMSKSQVKEDFQTLCASSKFVFADKSVKLKN